jgi:hypothetical protein
MPLVNCIVCEREFYVKPNRIKKGWGKYCSKQCNYQGQKTGIILPCFNCGQETYKTTVDQKRSQSGRYFCSKSCQTVWRNSELFVGEHHANWRGGESSYRDALRRAKVVQVCARCKIHDARVLAVHHKDRNRQNNTITNLTWLCHNCHFLIHRYQEGKYLA